MPLGYQFIPVVCRARYNGRCTCNNLSVWHHCGCPQPCSGVESL